MSVSFIYSQSYSLTGILWAVRYLANTGKIAPIDVCSMINFHVHEYVN